MLATTLAWARTPVLVLGTLLLAADSAASQTYKAKAYLVRPDPAPDADAVGKLKLESKPDEQEFDLDVKHVDGAQTHDVYLETAADSGVLEFIGSMVGDDATGDDELELEFETEDGDALPFGVASVEELLGRDLEVRVGGQVILFTTTPADLAVKGKFKAVDSLVRSAESPDPDARGLVVLVSEPGKGRERFGIVAKLIDGMATHDLYMDDGTGSIELVGPLGGYSQDAGDDDDDDPEVEFEAETKHGETLPLNVASVTELLGRRVEIRVADEIVLFGEIPASFGDDDEDDGDDDEQELEIELERPDGALDEDAEGELEIEIKSNGNEEFEVEAERVDITLLHELWLEEPAGSGTMVFATNMAPDFEDIDQLAFSRDTKRGQSLPFGVATVTELFGRRIEIRSADQLVLEGAVPGEFINKKVTLAAATSMAPAAAAAGAGPDSVAPAGKLTIRSKSHKGDERFEIRAKKLDFSATSYSVFVESAAGSDAMLEVAPLQKQGKHNGRLLLRTKQGAALPLGVLKVMQLVGRRVEIRDAGGAVHLTATVPDPMQ